MKFGYRKPSFKKSLKARTTGKAKRTLKRSIDPTYGKSGMGYIKNPKKALYNKAYNKTTRSMTRDLQSIGKTTAATSSCVGCVGCFPVAFTFVLVVASLL